MTTNFAGLPLRDLVQELLTNTSESVHIRAAINDLLVRRNSNLYDLIKADGGVGDADRLARIQSQTHAMLGGNISGI
jgi:hypothetical protein